MLNSFLLIGQSNMAGRGRMDEADPIENQNVFMFRENAWKAASEPLHTDKPELAGIGLGMSFADELQKKYNAKIGLIPCAVGGTSLDEWKKDGTLYTNAVKQARAALQDSTLKGILWHQGEADSGNPDTANSYKERFITMISSLCEDINCTNIPIIIGGLGDFLELHNQKCSYWNVINQSLTQLCEERSDFAFVSSSGFTHNGDTLHFNSKSLREFGLRYAKVWQECSSKLNISLEV